MRRSEVVRKEKELMVHYATAHEDGDDRKKADVMREIQKNIQHRKIAR